MKLNYEIIKIKKYLKQILKIFKTNLIYKQFIFHNCKRLKHTIEIFIFFIHFYPYMKHKKESKGDENSASSAVETWSISDIESMFPANVARAKLLADFKEFCLFHSFSLSLFFSLFALLLFIHLR